MLRISRASWFRPERRSSLWGCKEVIKVSVLIIFTSSPKAGDRAWTVRSASRSITEAAATHNSIRHDFPSNCVILRYFLCSHPTLFLRTFGNCLLNLGHMLYQGIPFPCFYTLLLFFLKEHGVPLYSIIVVEEGLSPLNHVLRFLLVSLYIHGLFSDRTIMGISMMCRLWSIHRPIKVWLVAEQFTVTAWMPWLLGWPLPRMI